MKIQLDETEIGEAVECYLSKQGVNTGSYDLSFNVIAGRTDTGPRVEINMIKKDERKTDIPDEEPVIPFQKHTES